MVHRPHVIKELNKMATILIQNLTVRRVTKYVAPNLVISMSARIYKSDKKRKKRDVKSSRSEFVIKIGSPNYLERKFIKVAKKANEEFPIKKLQLKYL